MGEQVTRIAVMSAKAKRLLLEADQIRPAQR
jgi:hypothetical protein